MAPRRRLTWRDAPVPTGPPRLPRSHVGPPGGRARARKPPTPRAHSSPTARMRNTATSTLTPLSELVIPLRPTHPGPQTLRRARPTYHQHTHLTTDIRWRPPGSGRAPETRVTAASRTARSCRGQSTADAGAELAGKDEAKVALESGVIKNYESLHASRRGTIPEMPS